MTIPSDTDVSAAPWSAGAAYLYTLDLDGPALAWEYLRRHAGYRADWLSGKRSASRGSASNWGLQSSRKPSTRCPPDTPALDCSG